MKEKRLQDSQWIEKSIEEIIQSKNLGLCKQLDEKKRFEFLEDLSQTYIMLSISDVQKRINSRFREEMKDSEINTEGKLV